MAISKDTLIADILKETPGSKDIFEKFNMGCISCLGIQLSLIHISEPTRPY